jgi:predicted lipid-binding transport protein (Tim44 family)
VRLCAGRRSALLCELRRPRDAALKRSPSSARLPLALGFAAVSFANGAAAFARGGGGGHGGGGGGHSGGGGSSSFGGYHSSSGYHGGYYGGSGTGGSSPMGFFASLAIMFVLIVITVLIIYLIFLLRRGRPGAPPPNQELERGGSGTTLRFSFGLGARAVATSAPEPEVEPEPVTLSELEQTLDAIRSADPDFEAETFLQRAEMAFFLVTRAYQHVDAKAGRPYMSAEAFEAWKRDLDAFASSGRRPIFDDLNVRGLHVAAASHGEAGDEIVVHFDVVYRLRIVSAVDGKVLNDDGDDRRRGQRWTFRRNAGVKTLTEGGVVAMKCPECGGPLELSSDGRCKFCRADVSAGGLDWTVSAIALAEFQGAQPEPLFGATRLDPSAGFAAIAASDPQFDGAAFVERVRGAFVALQEAWSSRDLDVARGFMSPGLYYGWSTQVETMAAEQRKNVIENVQIRSIAPVGVVHGRAVDDVTVRIDAACVDYEVDERTGRTVFGSRDLEPFVEFWTFQRSTNAKTPEHGLLDKRCPNCGAPLDVNQIGQCHYCKAAVTSGKFDWVLSRIEQEEEVAYAYGSGG